MNDSTPFIGRILVPHDFSETAEKALGLALDLAGKLGASVTIMHAYEIPTYAFPEGLAVTVSLGGEIDQASREALEAVARRARRPNVDVSIILRQGMPWSEIGAVAKEQGAGLIVMGTHGRRGFAHMLLGSVAEKVVRTAPCPVLTVHGPETASPK